MAAFLQQVFSLLTTIPGSLAYNLVLAFSLVAAFLVTLSHARSSPDGKLLPVARRILLGVSLLFILRLVLFLCAGLAWQRVINAVLVLPVLERGADLLSLLVIIWLWVFPEPNRLGDIGAAMSGLLLVALTALTMLAEVNLGVDQALNGTLLDQNVQKLALGLSAAGIILLLVRRPAGWPTGLVMISLLGAGHLLQLLLPADGDYSGPVRLAQMIAYPLLITLPYRQPLTAARNDQAPVAGTQDDHVDAVTPRLQALVMDWIVAADPRQSGEMLAAALAQDLHADLCLFLWPPDSAGIIEARYGYDQVHRRAIPDLALDSRSLPVITPAFQQPQALRLPGNSTAPDLRLLAQALDLKRTGALLSIPVVAEDGLPVLQVMMLSPFTARRWQLEDQQRLAEIARPLARILQRNRQVAATQDELAQTRHSLQSSQDRMLKAETDRSNLIGLASTLQQPGSDLPASSSQDSGFGQQEIPGLDPALSNSLTEPSPQPPSNIGEEGIERDLEHEPSKHEGSQRE